jgi:hypothetical protein
VRDARVSSGDQDTAALKAAGCEVIFLEKASVKWLAANAGTWRGDPRRLALAGEGAGGTLALATAIGTADAGLTRPKAE